MDNILLIDQFQKSNSELINKIITVEKFNKSLVNRIIKLKTKLKDQHKNSLIRSKL